METIETARLLLRPFDHGDAPRVLDILSRIDVIRWLGNPPFVPMPDLDAARAWIDRWHDREDMPRHWARAVVVKETGVMAGTVLVAPMERIDGGYVGEHEVGWHLHPDSVGHGYATEAAEAAFGRALAVVDEMWCGMYPDNAPSAAVATRLGLPDLGVLPDPWYGGESRMFRVTRDEWSNRDQH
jgi:RimJ/RimL family protein N-acetyltransferase